MSRMMMIRFMLNAPQHCRIVPSPPPCSNLEECLGLVDNEGSAVHEHVGDLKLGEDGDGGCDSCIICSECSTTCSMSGT